MKPTPPPPDIPDGLTAHEKENFLIVEGQSYNLKEKVPAAYMFNSCLGIVRDSQCVQACESYLDDFLKEAGRPQDPVERLLLLQIDLAYQNIGRLHSQAANAATLEAANVYNAAAARLLGEFRRCVLALRDYRMPISEKNITVVKQQNVAAGDQQIANISNPHEETVDDRKNHITSEQVSKGMLEYVPATEFIPESTSSSRRAKEPIETRTTYD